MLICDENNRSILLENIMTPVLSDSFWVLDLSMFDYTLTPLQTLEETVCPSLAISVSGFEFVVPSMWHILIVDPETQQLDMIEFGTMAGNEFHALEYGSDYTMFRHSRIVLRDYFPERQIIAPSLNNNQLLCHPISPTGWINIAPSDTYNKFLKNKVAGDLI